LRILPGSTRRSALRRRHSAFRTPQSAFEIPRPAPLFPRVVSEPASPSKNGINPTKRLVWRECS
jgi:hypothetical protein